MQPYGAPPMETVGHTMEKQQQLQQLWLQRDAAAYGDAGEASPSGAAAAAGATAGPPLQPPPGAYHAMPQPPIFPHIDGQLARTGWQPGQASLEASVAARAAAGTAELPVSDYQEVAEASRLLIFEPPRARTFIAWSIVTFIVFMPLGLPAVILSCLASQESNYGRARRYSVCAKILNMLLVIVVVVALICVYAQVISGNVFSASSSSSSSSRSRSSSSRSTTIKTSAAPTTTTTTTRSYASNPWYFQG